MPHVTQQARRDSRLLENRDQVGYSSCSFLANPQELGNSKHVPKAVRGDSPDNRSLTSSIVSSMVFLKMPQ